jgi:membrane protease YdiL (CAAX protease family)
MNWLLAAAAPALVAGVYFATGWIHPAIVAYHVLCAVAILARRDRVRALFQGKRSTVLWAIGSSAAIAAFLAVASLVLDPRPYRGLFLHTLLPRHAAMLFWVFAAYTMIIHAPLEEVFWRGIVLNPASAAPSIAIAGNGIFFYALHAAPLAMLLGPRGALMALPTLAAGAFWAFITIRSRSLWPGLVSHWGADGVILGLMWFFFIR